MIRFNKIRIASMLILAIFFLGSMSVFAQTAAIKVMLTDAATDLPLKSWKVQAFINDSLWTSKNSTDNEGWIMFEGLKSGKYKIKIEPDGYIWNQVDDVRFNTDRMTYLRIKCEPGKPKISKEQKRKLKK